MTQPNANEKQLLITLQDGQTARLVRHDAKKTAIHSPGSFPPGATARGTVTGCAAPFELKVRDCRRDGDGFLIEGRTQNATRELNALLKEYGGAPQH